MKFLILFKTHLTASHSTDITLAQTRPSTQLGKVRRMPNPASCEMICVSVDSSTTPYFSRGNHIRSRKYPRAMAFADCQHPALVRVQKPAWKEKSPKVSAPSSSARQAGSILQATSLLSKRNGWAYAWINFWIFVMSLLMIWDAGYIFMRPRSLPGGDLRWIWSVYSYMEPVDHLYGKRALDLSDGLLGSIGAINLVETVLNCMYIWKTYLVETPERSAPLYAFTSASMCLAKMIILVARQHFCGWCELRHNEFLPLFWNWIFPT
ncbi:hypothetical protein AX16_004450, partial [Volvariella volvacea WC 439]